MENKNLTVWQRLSHAFGPNAMLNQDVPTYKFDKKELLRTQDKNDFERQRLQAQQTFYLSNQWSKIDNHLYTQAIYYEPSRLASVYDFEAMEYSLFAETKIATPDGFYTIKELADKGRDYEFITYAYDHNLKKVVPAKAYNAHYTRDEMTYKITFDDNSHIIATYGHRFLKRDGVFCEVENLQVGDSMMPFYRKSFYNNQNYNWIYTCNNNEGHHGWVKEDVLMAELNPKELNERTFMASKIIPWDLLVETAKKEKSMRNVSIVLGISIYELDSKIQVGGFNDWATFMEAYGLDVPNEKIEQKESNEVLVNHKIISIEPYGVVPVYDLTVPGYKNFATDTIFSHNTPEIGAALDIYAEESTTTDENGFMLQIYSESKRIKSVLTDLFNNVLDINTNLPMWTRNTPIREDSIIPLLDGTEVTIKELSERIKKGEEVWTYSIQQGTTAIVCSKIIWCDLTRENSELVRVTFDDGTYIDTTPDHEYMLRNGSFMRADLLKPNQSLMPFYSKKSDESNNRIHHYEKVYNPNTGKYKFTHRMVAHEYVRNLEYENSINEIFDTHHIDFKKINNNPNNLLRLTRSEHLDLHMKNYDKVLGSPEVTKKRMEGIRKYLKSDSRRERMSKEMKGIYPKYFKDYNNSELHSTHNEIRSLGMLKNWSSNTFVEKTKKRMTIHLNDNCISHITNIIVNSNRFIGINELSLILKNDNEFINLFKETYTLNKNILKSINPTTLNKLFFRQLNKNYFEFLLTIKPNITSDKKFIKARSIHLGKIKDIKILNHKVVSVIKLEETSNVYCLEAVGPNGEHDRHNFAVCSKDINGNHTRNGVFLANCKFGDNFIYLKLDPEKGIVGCNQLPNIEIERLEPGGEDKTVSQSTNKVINDSLKFRWKNKTMEFQPWEVAHFRILGDDRKLPYGTSILEKARRIWKQLLLAEDAMLIYRTSRAPERRVFKVFVGNMDDNDVEAYVNRVANKFKREQVVDSKTGNVDMRYNQMAVDQDYFVPVRDPSAPSPIETLPGACVSLDTRIPLLDGRVLELNKIIEEWDNGNRNLWAYSCNPTTGDLAPGLITWAGVTRKNTNVLKITLDNGEQVITTPDHKFVHRTNGFVEAQNLKVGDSLMPFYQKTDTQQVWNLKTSNWSLVKPLTKSNISIYENAIETLEKDWELIEEGSLNNHKITSIEILGEKMDTGTITIDGNEIYHNYHTFAIESGIFIKNSNLGDIADIEYIQKKLVTALRIPKSFLGFEEVVGDGKTLSIQDIRFARTINRIQKCMLAELNKIAIVHLFLLGFEDEISNFTLGLTNPSVQSDLLKIDVWKEKIMLYRDAVSDPGSGVAAVSATWAKKHIFGFSDEEIRLDLQQQRIERAVGQELLNTALVIKKTGLFDNIDKLYGDVSGSTTGENATATPGDTGSGSMSSGGLDMGGLDMGGLDMGGEESAEGAPPPPPPLPNEAPGEPTLAAESKLNNLNILVESNMIDGASYIPLTKGQNSLGVINDELKKLLNL